MLLFIALELKMSFNFHKLILIKKNAKYSTSSGGWVNLILQKSDVEIGNEVLNCFSSKAVPVVNFPGNASCCPHRKLGQVIDL